MKANVSVLVLCIGIVLSLFATYAMADQPLVFEEGALGPIHPEELKMGLGVAAPFLPDVSHLPICPPPTKAEATASFLPPMTPDQIRAYYKEHPPKCQHPSSHRVEKVYPPTELIPYWHIGDPSRGEPREVIAKGQAPSPEDVRKAHEFYQKHPEKYWHLLRVRLPLPPQPAP